MQSSFTLGQAARTRAGALAALAVAAVLGTPAFAAAEKFLLLDVFDAAHSVNTVLAPGPVEKFPGNPLLRQEHPWEPSFDNLCPSLLWDEEEQVYKLWYSIFVVNVPDPAKTTAARRAWLYRESGVCYAVSRDGIHWEKPLLPGHPFRGRPSNVVMRNAHGAGVFKDLREPDPARRYKMIFQRERHGRRQGVAVAFSPDGIHWSEPVDQPQARARADTHNNAIWAPELGRYVAITRDWDFTRRAIRQVARMESPDFLHWSESRVVFAGDSDDRQIYGMPFFPYGRGYLGLPAIFRTAEDRLHVEIARSPDTVAWTRIAPGQPLLANSEPKGAYDWGCIFAAATPVVRPDGIRLYYAASDDTHFGHRKTFLALAMLRPDGFAGAAPADAARPAEIVTEPVAWSGGALAVTADLEAGGSLRAVLLEAGTGRELARTIAWSGPHRATAEPLRWEGVPAAGAARVRIKFELERGMVFAVTLAQD